jgi:hypothetical protein
MFAALLALVFLAIASVAHAQIRSEVLDNPVQHIHPAMQRAAENLDEIQRRIPDSERVGLTPNPNKYVIITPGARLDAAYKPVVVAGSLPSLARRRLVGLEAPINAGMNSAVFDRLPDDREHLVEQVPHLSPKVSRIVA